MGTKGREISRCSFDLLPLPLKPSMFSRAPSPRPHTPWVPSLEAQVLGRDTFGQLGKAFGVATPSTANLVPPSPITGA